MRCPIQNPDSSVTVYKLTGTTHVRLIGTDYTVPSGASAIHIRTEEAAGGSATVRAAPWFPSGSGTPSGASACTLPLWVYGGDGNDTITGGNGGDTIVGGSGRNVIHEGTGWNTPEIIDDSDGYPNFQGSLTGELAPRPTMARIRALSATPPGRLPISPRTATMTYMRPGRPRPTPRPPRSTRSTVRPRSRSTRPSPPRTTRLRACFGTNWACFRPTRRGPLP